MKTLKTSLVIYLSCLFFIGCFYSCTKDETEVNGNIYGYVTNEKGVAIQAASITLNPSGKTTTTGSDGRYEYQNLPAGQYTIQAASDGYQTNTKGITVVAGTSVQGDIILKGGD